MLNRNLAVLTAFAVCIVICLSQAAAEETDAAPKRTVLLEQFTAQNCGICPGDMRYVAEQTSDYDVVTLTYHYFDELSTEVIDDFVEQFTTSFPEYLVDRSLDGLLSTFNAPGTIITRSQLSPELKIELERGYDPIVRTAPLRPGYVMSEDGPDA